MLRVDPDSDPYRLMNCRFFNNKNQCRRSEPRSDWHHFDGSGPGSTFRACRSGSVSISSKCKDKLLFTKKCRKYWKIWHLWRWWLWERQNSVNWQCCENRIKNFWFSNMCKIWIRIESGSGPASKRCRSTTLFIFAQCFLGTLGWIWRFFTEIKRDLQFHYWKEVGTGDENEFGSVTNY